MRFESVELAGVDVNADGNEEDGDEAEVDDGVNQNGGSTGLHVPKLRDSSPAWYLEEKARA